MNPAHWINPQPPRSGISLQQNPNRVTVSVNDEGGRGWPWAAIFIPVIQVGELWHVVLGRDKTSMQYSGDELFLTSAWVQLERTEPANMQPEPPYLFAVDRSDWPKHGDFVLVLLLYRQFKEIGFRPGDFFAPWSLLLSDKAPWWAPYKKAVTENVQKYLASATWQDLSPGLISMAGGPPASGPALPANPERSLAAVHAPAPAATQPAHEPFTFAVASCLYPSDFLDRMPDDIDATEGPADASLLALGECLKSADPTQRPTLLLLLGDQVYVDATAGLFDPKAQDDKFRIPYDRSGASRGMRSVRLNFWLDVHCLLDDHEISDNWAPNDSPAPPRGERAAIDEGKEAYWKFQRQQKLPVSPGLWRADVIHMGLPFFLGDTRTDREVRNACSWDQRQIMGRSQFQALRDWMTSSKHANLPKFVATPSALLPRRLAVARDPACALHSDGWDGYPRSLHDLLAYVCQREIKGLVFLSGDEHISNYTKICVTDLSARKGSRGKKSKQCTLHSVHSSALYAPYPFANAIQEDFAGSETFRFRDSCGGHYLCQVHTSFAPAGDGFALLTAIPPTADAGWQLKVAFHKKEGIAPTSETLDLI